MSGDTHAVIGATSAVLMTQPTTVTEAAISILFGTIGGLLIDIDTKRSQGARLIRMLTIPLITYLIIGIWLLLAYHINILLLATKGLEPRTLIAMLLIGVLYFYGYHSPHRRFTHSIEFISMTWGLCYIAGFQFTLPLIAGEISHIAIDLLNKTEVRLSCIAKFDFCMRVATSDGICNQLLKTVAIGLLVILLFLYLPK